MERTKLAKTNEQLSSSGRAAALSNGKVAPRREPSPASPKSGQADTHDGGAQAEGGERLRRARGSDDLAPSSSGGAIAAAERRFAKRYGSAARAKKARIKK